ncbi:MAG: carbohydrate porin [Sandaracinaceae bacterium]
MGSDTSETRARRALLFLCALALTLMSVFRVRAQDDTPLEAPPDEAVASEEPGETAPPDTSAEPAPTEEEEPAEPWYRRGDTLPGASATPAPTDIEVPPPAEDRAQDDAADDAAADDAAPDDDEEEEEEEDRPHGDFYFGSYGRVIAATDLEGRTGQPANLTTWGPRIDESDAYAEIELRREDHFAGMHTQIVATVAYGGPLFHYDGEFSERIAIRNLFVETRDFLAPGLRIWGGSRMWRGDDIYLYNFWPLDNLNLVGGGVAYALEDIGELSLAGGLSQPNDPFQRQEILTPARAGFSPDRVVFLDRPRLVVAGKLTWWPFGRLAQDGMKAILYGESHYLPSGDRRNDAGFTETLPDDIGWVVGAQLGGYLSGTRTFANLFVRYARGLGAYDPLGVPFTEGAVIQTGRAEEFRVALSANYELDMFGLQVGAYYRWFRDADPNVFDRAALSEGSIDVRPHLWFGRFVGVGLDLSYQGIATSAINERTGSPEGGHIFKAAFLPFISPFGRGTYTRPHIRLIYSLTVRDDGARALYPVLDPRSANTVEHFLGLGVEWWFSSSSYGF